MTKLKKIFIAVDTNSVLKAKKIIKYTKSNKLKIGYKFGLEFVNSKHGRKFISKLKNKIIFLDLKLNDIPNTMLSTVQVVKDLKINYLTVHISSGLDALKAVKKVAGKIKIVGVTTLTSLNNKDLKQIGHKRVVRSLVIHQTKLANKANLDALVCSPHEVGIVRKIFKKEIITPGVKFGKKNKDQKRSMNIKKINSDWIVIGRGVTKGNIKKNIQELTRYLK